MLTKSDIKQIRTAVQEEVHKETDPIKKDTEGLKKDTKSLKAGQARTDKTLKKIRNDLEMATGFLDKDRSEVSKRVDRIDNYLHFSSTAS